ncbi:MAG: hypothetical protein O3C40_34845 [Planctomycetota bacterium]|nr:hypothetical protein [Planctomycetota bacterium]
MATVEQLKTKKATKGKLGPDRWDEWATYLAQRTKPVPLAKLIAAKQASPLQWTLPADVRNSNTEDLLVRLQSLKSRTAADAGEIAAELEHWLESARVREASARFALEALAWCHALPVLANSLTAAPWSQLVDQLVSIASDAEKCDLSAAPLPQQLLAGELPLSLAYLLPELSACKRLASPARDALSLGLTELLDGEGMPHANCLQVGHALFACWTRCHYLGRTMKQNCFTKDAKTQYEWLVRQMMRLCRNDGKQVFSTDADGAWSPTLFEAALTLARDADDDEIADCILPGRKASQEPRGSLPSPAVNSEWAELAVLRRGWDRSGDQLMVSYSNRQVRLELNCGSETVFSGNCNPELRVDGKLLEMELDWEEVCWHCDKDLDYLELEGRFENGWKVQRQMLLARDDRFLLLADAVLGETTADIEHQFTLPLPSGISFTPADETREGILRGRKPIAAVLPLQLPEWRAERAEGSLEQTTDGLRLRQKVRGRRLLAPLFIDLKPKRFSRQLTWRRLTVAQQLEILPADVAVGYRVQTGKRQWVIYRSLAPVASRSVLGQHFSGEFVLGRFPKEGELKQLIEIG